MRIGLQLPQGYFNEFDGWEPARAWARILEIAQLGERLGFESLWTGEHVLSKWGGKGSIAFDCFVLSSAVAAVCPRAEIGFDVVNSTFRNPALTAKMAATLDAVSNGRVILGLGCGFKPLEASAYGFEYPSLKERLAVLTEHFEIITKMLDNGELPFSFEGDHAKVQDMDSSPRSSGRRRMKIMAAGRGPNVTFRLAAKYADILNVGTQLEEAPDVLPLIRQRCEEIGRDPATLELQAALNASVKYRGLTNVAGQRMMAPHEFGFTDPKYLENMGSRVEEIAGWRDHGVAEMVVAVPGLHNTDETIYEMIEDIRTAGVEFPRPGRGEAAARP
jgi:alkanesulfonate monooxygenase SsuD/methylene tetrahydromethanopterin reductase-like flavin-dependent oxidoreductase (luciferase family)